MFPRLALFVVSAIALLAAAAPGGPSSGQCNTGPVQCCNSVYEPTSSVIASELANAGLEASDLTGLVGVGCEPINIISGGTSCSASPVCCSGNTYTGLFVVGCSPIGVGA